MSDAPLRRLSLDVPALLDEPYFGRGCCTVRAADAVADELRSWRRWVRRVEADECDLRFIVVLTEDAPIKSILGSLEFLGYPAEVVHSEAFRD